MSYSPDARQLAINVYRNSDWSIATAAKMLGIAKATLQEWLERDQAGESLEDRSRCGRPPRLNDVQRRRLVELTEQHSDWIQQRYADALNAEFPDLHLTQPDISIELKRAGISLKKNSGAPTSRPASESSSAPSAS